MDQLDKQFDAALCRNGEIEDIAMPQYDGLQYCLGHKGRDVMKKAKEAGDGFIGKYFHTRNEKREIECQGIIIESAPGGYFCQLFEWFTGGASDIKFFSIEQVRTFWFYSCAEDMRLAYYKYRRMSERDIEHAERCIKCEKG